MLSSQNGDHSGVNETRGNKSVSFARNTTIYEALKGRDSFNPKDLTLKELMKPDSHDVTLMELLSEQKS